MRAIGMSELQLRGMVRMEGILYALHCGLWGAVLGIGSTFAVHRIVSKELPDMVPAWQFPWLSVLLALAGTSAIILLSTVLPLRRLRRLAIVDSIRHVE
jgi:putative ABC transport system permease protein